MSAVVEARVVARRRSAARRSAAAWGRTVLLAAVTAVVLLPLIPVVRGAVVGRDGRFAPLGLVQQLAGGGPALTWFLDSVVVSLATVAVTVLVAAPAGYALARVRTRSARLAAILLLGLQALPAMVLLPPLYVLLVHVGGVDSLAWLTVLYVGFSLAVATWTTTAWFSTLPIEVEEAAWLDGCSALGAFVKVVLPGSGPALVSTALITFLFAWNDYWIALLFIQDQTAFTIGLALVSGGRTPALAVLALLPPLVVFLVLHRRFRFGGLADAAMR
jgi:multiple sugar transport system permease protein